MNFSDQTSRVVRQILIELFPLRVLCCLAVCIDISLVFEAVSAKTTTIFVNRSPELHLARPSRVLIPINLTPTFLRHIQPVEQTVIKNVTSMRARNLMDQILPVSLSGMLRIDKLETGHGHIVLRDLTAPLVQFDCRSL